MLSHELAEIEERWKFGTNTRSDVRKLLNEVQLMTRIKAEPFMTGDELGPLATRTIYIRPDTQDEIAYREVVIENEYKIGTMGQTDIIVDVGANIGSFALLCVSKGAGKVFCFEPDPANFDVLQENVKGLPVSSHELAVWRSDKKEEIRLIHRHPGETAMMFTRPGTEGDKVHCVSMDTILSRLDSVRILKLDCEGAEWPILYTSKELRRCREIICEIHFQMQQSAFSTDAGLLVNHLEGQGFECKVELHPKCPDLMAHLWARRKG